VVARTTEGTGDQVTVYASNDWRAPLLGLREGRRLRDLPVLDGHARHDCLGAMQNPIHAPPRR
jgi:hypothetical protein